MTPKNYDREVSLIRSVAKFCEHAEVGEAMTAPFIAAARASGSTSRFADAAAAVCGLRTSGLMLTRRLAGASKGRHSRPLKQAWMHAEHIGTVPAGKGNNFDWRLIAGVPVVCDRFGDSTWYAAPESASEIFARLRGTHATWRVVDGGLVADHRPVPSYVCLQAREAIKRTRRFDSCRAWLFEGPPGGGKTVAARQVAAALAGAVIVVPPSSAGCGELWEAIDAIAPDGLILDDVDSVADVSGLLDRLESARAYARIIISTANVTDGLRGAVLRPGRAADEDPVQFPAPDATTSKAIAPSVSGGEGLLTCYLAEAEARVQAGVDPDIEGLRARMIAAGDR